MRIHWKELRQYDEKAMEKTIAQCQTLMKHKENWFVSKKTAYRQFAKLEIKRINVVYGFFLLCLLYFLLFSEQMKIGIVLLYYLLLGSYFLYQLYEFKNNDMEELMQALPIHEGKRFILHMCTFLIIHLISFLSFSIVGYLRMDISMLEIMQLALIPLFLAHGCMLFFLNRIKRLYTAFISYIILFLFFSNFFHPILINSSALQLGWIQTLIVSLFSTVLFLIAAYRYGLKLQRRIHYGA